MKKILFLSSTLSLSLLSVAAMADTRYEQYCVTTPTDSSTVLMYDDLITSSSYTNETLKNLVETAEVYTLRGDLKLPKDSPELYEDVRDTESPYTRRSQFEAFLKENKKNINTTFYSNKPWIEGAKKSGVLYKDALNSVYGKNFVTVKEKNIVLFNVPYRELGENENNRPFGTIKGQFIFNKKAVTTLNYYDCGMGLN